MSGLLCSPTLRGLAFAHGFTTRGGDLDFAASRAPAALERDRSALARALGVDQLYVASQVHGATVRVAEGPPAAFAALEADALVAEPGSSSAVGVRVADCVPVLLADPATGRVAAVHAGWRGLEAGIVERTVEELARAPGAGRAAGFVAAVGPCIRACCFEVGVDVAARIAARVGSATVVARRAGDKALVDLVLGTRAALAAGGVELVDVVGGCSRCEPERYHSFRRDGAASGRMMGVIAARSPP